MNLCKHSLPEVTCRECSKPIDTRIDVPNSTLKMHPPKQKPRKPCAAEGCDRDEYSRGYCSTHIQRLRKHGSLENPPREPKRVKNICQGCGCSFETMPSRTREYCNRKCWRETNPGRSEEGKKRFSEIMRAQRVGEGNPNYKHGESRTPYKRELFHSGQIGCQDPRCADPQADVCQHHVVYRQHVKRLGGDEWDQRDALALCRSCHMGYHNRRDLPLTVLRDENIVFAFELMGAAAYDYFHRYYAGSDERVERALVEFEEAQVAA